MIAPTTQEVHEAPPRSVQVSTPAPPRSPPGSGAAALAVVLLAGIGGLAVSVASRSGQAAAGPGALPGLQTGPAPWTADSADLVGSLRTIGLPPLSPIEGTAVHIHQHLDLYVDGREVPVPAGIGIDPAVGFAPLHTHDASGMITSSPQP